MDVPFLACKVHSLPMLSAWWSGREGRGGELGQHDGPLDKLRSCKHGRRCWGNRNVILGHRLGSNLWGKRIMIILLKEISEVL